MKQRNSVKMSELLESVRRSFYHDILSFSDAEARLEGKEMESDVKSVMFIISYVKNSSVSHILIPRKDGKYFIQTVGSFLQHLSLPELYSSSSSSEFSK